MIFQKKIKLKHLLETRVQKFPNRYWFAVPKPLNNDRGYFGVEEYRYWRMSFYEYEKDILSCNGRAKPIIRHLKKFRDTQQWKSISSYYIETLCLQELDIFQNSDRVSCTSLFFTMLEKLSIVFHDRKLNSYWTNNLNLLDNISDAEFQNMEGRLNNIIKDIKRNIRDDPYVIARHVLNNAEFDMLHIQESEPESESSNQSRCVII
ncbi:hypothetical protein DMN91_004178 [Ooceraea biroi]|uniref:Mab-21-like HhH/H2TH-like domain-containing protein n=1 Tax=Ooceraea biroi TaxID=2015173 RepID=A0A3L8DU28_OOCBI|nr:hypothetical protein DMN91_004178 [Ooceraea biroi]